MTTIYTTTFSLFLIGVSAQFNHENTQKNFTWISVIRSPYVQTPLACFFTRVLAQFNHSITLYATTFTSFLHYIFSTIQPCKYPQNLTWISAIRSPYMQSPSARFFTRVQHNSVMQIPTKLYLDFSHLITLYAATFSLFLY